MIIQILNLVKVKPDNMMGKDLSIKSFTGKTIENCIRQALEYLAEHYNNEDEDEVFVKVPSNGLDFITDDHQKMFTEEFLSKVIAEICYSYEMDMTHDWTNLEVQGDVHDFQILL